MPISAVARWAARGILRDRHLPRALAVARSGVPDWARRSLREYGKSHGQQPDSRATPVQARDVPVLDTTKLAIPLFIVPLSAMRQ